MSRPKRRQSADHAHAAAQAREMPGRWVLAGSYGSTQSADGAARHVRYGDRLPAYQPIGAYDTRVRLTEDGADLWVRYIAGQPAKGPAR